MTSVAGTVRKIQRAKIAQLRFTTTVDTSFVIPAGYAIDDWIIENTTANAVTGGLDIGTTDTGVDVASAFAVGASFIGFITAAALLKKYFSRTVNTTIFVVAHTSWNSASLTHTVMLNKINP